MWSTRPYAMRSGCTTDHRTTRPGPSSEPGPYEGRKMEHERDRVANLEEELRQRGSEVEREQLEREISGNLTPEDEEMIDLREERLRREAFKEIGMEDEEE